MKIPLSFLHRYLTIYTQFNRLLNICYKNNRLIVYEGVNKTRIKPYISIIIDYFQMNSLHKGELQLKTRYKLLISGAIAFLLVLGSYWLVNYISEKLTGANDSVTTQSEPLEDEEIEKLINTVPEETKYDLVEQFPDDMTEIEVMDAIHHMSHQKIHASEKWGKLQITPERVKRLLEVVKVKDYEHKELYLDILEEWNSNKFSNAVHAHNAIWNIKGGTLGKAERLLTPEEEARYIKENFN